MSLRLGTTRKCLLALMVAVFVSGVSVASDLQTTVRAILKEPPPSKKPNPPCGGCPRVYWQEQADAIQALQVDAFPVLTQQLGDPDYSMAAAGTMLVLDRSRAFSVLLKAAPTADMNAQDVIFAAFTHDCFASPCSAEWVALAHTAALSVLVESRQGDNLKAALYVVGLTGNKEDFPLLEKFYGKGDEYASFVSEAALAKLGSEKHRDNIKANLQRPLPRRYNMYYAGEVQDWLKEAAFVGSKDFVPLICRHLDDPIASSGDEFSAPEWIAAGALDAISNAAFPISFVDPEKWKLVCAGGWQALRSRNEISGAPSLRSLQGRVVPPFKLDTWGRV